MMTKFNPRKNSRHLVDSMSKVVNINQGVPIGEQAAGMKQVRYYLYYVPFYAMTAYEDGVDEKGDVKYRYSGGFASRLIEADSPIDSAESVLSLQQQIMTEGKYTGITLLPWILVTAQMKMVKVEAEQKGDTDESEESSNKEGQQ